MGYECNIIADSMTTRGERLVSFRIRFPRFILAEINTHKMLVKNSASSRAIPVEKRIADVLADPFVPAAFLKNQRGMQAGDELNVADSEDAETIWREAMLRGVEDAKRFAQLGIHKQWSNRFVELFAFHECVISGTEWANFFALRDNKMAAPEFQTIAHMMKVAYEEHMPRVLSEGDWHLPMIDWDDEVQPSIGADVLPKISAARCARVSYETHDTGKRDVSADLALYERLISSGHFSPLEHPARPMTSEEHRRYSQMYLASNGDPRQGTWVERGSFCGPFRGWVQLRKTIPGEDVFVPKEPT